MQYLVVDSISGENGYQYEATYLKPTWDSVLDSYYSYEDLQAVYVASESFTDAEVFKALNEREKGKAAIALRLRNSARAKLTKEECEVLGL